MKKTLCFLAILFSLVAFTSCDSEEELPDVNFKLEIEGGVFSHNTIYVARGGTIDIKRVDVINNEHGKGVTIPYVNYYFDNQFIGVSPVAPYNFEIELPDSIAVGMHSLQLTAPVYAVDKTPGYAIVSYGVMVVENPESLPSDNDSSATVEAHMVEPVR